MYIFQNVRFSFRRFVQLLKETNFTGVSGEINFSGGRSKQIAVNIMQFRVEGNLSRYKKVGQFEPVNNHRLGGM